MAGFSDTFLDQLKTQINAPHAASAKEAGGILTTYIGNVKDTIKAVGFGDLTREQFLALVAAGFDLFVSSMGLSPLLAAGLKAVVLSIAGLIWDKRHKPQP